MLNATILDITTAEAAIELDYLTSAWTDPESVVTLGEIAMGTPGYHAGNVDNR